VEQLPLDLANRSRDAPARHAGGLHDLRALLSLEEQKALRHYLEEEASQDQPYQQISAIAIIVARAQRSHRCARARAYRCMRVIDGWTSNGAWLGGSFAVAVAFLGV